MPSLRVTIVYDSTNQDCEAGCGADWAAEEIVDQAKRRLKERFGERVKLQVIERSSNLSGVKPEMESGSPLLLIDDQIRIAGPFDLRQLSDAVEAELEMRK